MRGRSSTWMRDDAQQAPTYIAGASKTESEHGWTFIPLGLMSLRLQLDLISVSLALAPNPENIERQWEMTSFVPYI